MKKIILLILLISFSAIAQRPNSKRTSKITLNGTVLETKTKQPLEYATLVLTNTKTKQVLGGVTNIKGLFSVDAPSGNYTIKVEFIGFKTKDLGTKNLVSSTNLGTILLSEDAETLDEVEIIAEKSTVEIRLDKKIYNVGKDMTVKGGNASDVLDNVPSVNVDVEGNVSLRGSENVRILIDGKPSSLVGLNGTDALKQLPSDAIEKVEVITSPSARYDAEGTAGILNIILRKGKITGFNGSINTSVGNPDLARLSTNLNYRTKKINLFSSIGYSYNNGPGNSNIDITNFNNNVITGFHTEDRDYSRKRKRFNSRIGLEYFLNDKSSLTGTFSLGSSDGNNYSTNSILDFDANKTETANNSRIEDEDNDGFNTQYSLNYTNNIDDKGQKLIINAQYSQNENDEAANISNNSTLVETNTTKSHSKNTLFQLDYVLPLGQKSQLEFGHKADLQKSNSDFIVNNITNDPNFFDASNSLDFNQNVYAFYTQYGRKSDKFSYLLGLRAEITDIDLTLVNTSETSKKDYTEWFPTVNFGFEINDTDNLTLGYSRRLRRPRSWFLNPFESRNSDTYIFKGNPDLDPTFTNSLDLGYTTRISKLTLNSSVYYQRSTNNFQFVTQEETRTIGGVPTPIQLRQPINLSSEDRYGFELTTNYNPSKKVRLSGSFNYFKFKTDGEFTYSDSQNQITTQNFDAKNSSWFARFNARITLPAKIEWQTRVMYRGPQEQAQSNRKGMLSTNLAFSKDILKDKASLVLNVSDVFNTRKRISTTYIPSRDNPRSITDQEFQWRQRQITLSFTYRFNQKKNQRNKAQQNQSFDGGGGEGYGG